MFFGQSLPHPEHPPLLVLFPHIPHRPHLLINFRKNISNNITINININLRYAPHNPHRVCLELFDGQKFEEVAKLGKQVLEISETKWKADIGVTAKGSKFGHENSPGVNTGQGSAGQTISLKEGRNDVWLSFCFRFRFQYFLPAHPTKKSPVGHIVFGQPEDCQGRQSSRPKHLKRLWLPPRSRFHQQKSISTQMPPMPEQYEDRPHDHRQLNTNNNIYIWAQPNATLASWNNQHECHWQQKTWIKTHHSASTGKLVHKSSEKIMITTLNRWKFAERILH